MRETMTDFEERLPGEQFVGVHRSIIINVTRLLEVQSIPKGDSVLIQPDFAPVERAARRFRP